MTLDDAILHAEEVAEENEKFCYKKGGEGGYFNEDTDWNNTKCAEEHRQLAEWLKQLRVYKLAFGMNEKKVTGIVCCDGKVYKAFENDPILKAIDKKGFHTFYGFVEVDE